MLPDDSLCLAAAHIRQILPILPKSMNMLKTVSLLFYSSINLTKVKKLVQAFLYVLYYLIIKTHNMSYDMKNRKWRHSPSNNKLHI